MPQGECLLDTVPFYGAVPRERSTVLLNYGEIMLRTVTIYSYLQQWEYGVVLQTVVHLGRQGSAAGIMAMGCCPGQEA